MSQPSPAFSLARILPRAGHGFWKALNYMGGGNSIDVNSVTSVIDQTLGGIANFLGAAMARVRGRQILLDRNEKIAAWQALPVETRGKFEYKPPPKSVAWQCMFGVQAALLFLTDNVTSTKVYQERATLTAVEASTEGAEAGQPELIVNDATVPEEALNLKDHPVARFLNYCGTYGGRRSDKSAIANLQDQNTVAAAMLGMWGDAIQSKTDVTTLDSIQWALVVGARTFLRTKMKNLLSGDAEMSRLVTRGAYDSPRPTGFAPNVPGPAAAVLT